MSKWIQKSVTLSFKLFTAYLDFLFYFLKKKLFIFSHHFEKQKNFLVKFLLMKRGRYNRPFLHLTAMIVLFIGVIIAPFLAETYPLLTRNNGLAVKIAQVQAQEQSITADTNVFQTKESQKPRSAVISYTAENGDTLSSIAKKFGISEDTIRWENDLAKDDLSIGQKLEILPVAGIAHKVQKGDTVYSIAKKYNTEAQKIVDFPFNDFANPETFSLIAGQMLVVPDGIKPSEQPTIKRQTYIVKGPIGITSAGFAWPLRGEISQFASWYHMGLDITSPMGTAIVSAQSGVVSSVNVGTWDGGYGTNVVVDNGNGFSTLYSHMSGVNVSAGQQVAAGQTVVGWVGMTGRTTGPHVHFEIRKNGVAVDPLPYLQ